MAHKKIATQNHVIPRDASWQGALKRALLFIVIGALLLPVGLVLYNLVPLPEELGVVTFLFAIMIFFGAILLLYGVLIGIMALVQRHKTPPAAEVKRIVLEEGAVCQAVVKEVKTKTRGEEILNRYTLEYDDADYRYKRRFVTDFTARKAAIGDKFTVHYFPDSNVNYYVELD